MLLKNKNIKLDLKLKYIHYIVFFKVYFKYIHNNNELYMENLNI